MATMKSGRLLTFEGKYVRVLMDAQCCRWWRVADVYAALGEGSPSATGLVSAVGARSSDRKVVRDHWARGDRGSYMTVVNEKGLRGVLDAVPTPVSGRFRRWVETGTPPSTAPPARVAWAQVAPSTSAAKQPEAIDVIERMFESLRQSLVELNTVVDEVSETFRVAFAELATSRAAADTEPATQGEWLTAVAYCELCGWPADVRLAKALGLAAARVGRRRGVRPRRVPNAQWGLVNSWPHRIWREAEMEKEVAVAMEDTLAP